nr:hypothetical protein [Lactobacillus helveticus]
MYKQVKSQVQKINRKL